MPSDDPNMKMVELIFAIVAVVVSVMSFIISRRADIRSKKAETIKNLLGEKESVAFAALKLLRDGLPKSKKDRDLIISALMQACLFEGSARARALLYRVIELNKMKYPIEFQNGLQTIHQNLDSMDKYKFTPKELNLSRGRKRIASVMKVMSENSII